MTRIIGLDLATSTGFCVGDIGGEPTCGSHTLPSTREDIGGFLIAFEDWLTGFIDRQRPDAGFFEAPILFKTHTMTARKLMCLAGETERIFLRKKVPISEVNIKSAKLFFAGHGNADKPMMVGAARKRGFLIGNCTKCQGSGRRGNRACPSCEGTGFDHNQADAAAIWTYGVASTRPGVFVKVDPVPGPPPKPRKPPKKKKAKPSAQLH